MKHPVGLLALVLALVSYGQEVKFLAADVHVSTRPLNQGTRPPVTRGEFYEVKNATLADLVGFAYNTNPTRVLEGPSWLEMNRYDVIAKQPRQSAPEDQQKMLRALLAERFGLVVKEETRPVPNFALMAGRSHKLKEADGSGDKGCRPQSSNAPPGSGTLRLSMANPDGGTPIQLTLADGMVEYRCRNMTMAEFAAAVRTLLATNLGTNPVIDQTGLSGIWNFDIKYSIGLVSLEGGSGPTVSISEAVDKQLGLKLEQTPIPTPVVVVVSANAKPIDNPPGTAEAIPATAFPKEFEVATVKPTDPNSRTSRMQTQGGRVVIDGLPLTLLLSRAFIQTTTGQLVGVPTWANTARFDMTGLIPGDSAPNTQIDPDLLAPMMQAFLKERFNMKWHTEERELPAYNLVAGKPKMKQADPASRSWCKAPGQVPGAPPAPSGSQVMICQNISMAQFADLLRGRAPDMEGPVYNATGLEGGWDFTLTFNPLIGLAQLRAPSPVAAGAAAPAVPEPMTGYTIFEAIERQLGLKLEKSKHTQTVFVIDNIDQTPTEN